jgi:hypothetical protein
MRYFIGWDVGAWHCQEDGDSSKDAIAVLDENLRLIGLWEGNLGDQLVEKHASGLAAANEFLDFVMSKCTPSGNDKPISYHHFILAIDTPLGWPRAFLNLVRHFSTKTVPARKVSKSFPLSSKIANPLLHRKTETLLGKALSAVQDQIGSQSTKALFLLRDIGAVRAGCGVWNVDGANLSIIETYPSPCLRSLQFIEFLTSLQAEKEVDSGDKFDGIVCAAAAFAFSRPESSNILLFPSTDIDSAEGWIFRPNDLIKASYAISYGRLIGNGDSFAEMVSRICTGTTLEIAVKLSKKKKATDQALFSSWNESSARIKNPNADELQSLYKLLHPKKKPEHLPKYEAFAKIAESMRRDLTQSMPQ